MNLNDSEDAYNKVNANEPHHKKSWTHELVAAAAGFAAMKAYEDRCRDSGETVSHGKMKELLAAFAAAEADKLVETKGLDFLDREKLKRMSAHQAHALAKEKYGEGQVGPGSGQGFGDNSGQGYDGNYGQGFGGNSGQGYDDNSGQGFRGNSGQGYDDNSGQGFRGNSGQGYDDNSGQGFRGNSGQGYDDNSGQGFRGNSGQGYDDNYGRGVGGNPGQGYNDNY